MLSIVRPMINVVSLRQGVSSVILPPLGTRTDFAGCLKWNEPEVSGHGTMDAVSGSQRKRKVLLLLTLSGVIRPAGVEQRYFGGVATGAHQNGPSSATDPIPLAETSQTAIVGSS